VCLVWGKTNVLGGSNYRSFIGEVSGMSAEAELEDHFESTASALSQEQQYHMSADAPQIPDPLPVVHSVLPTPTPPPPAVHATPPQPMIQPHQPVKSSAFIAKPPQGEPASAATMTRPQAYAKLVGSHGAAYYIMAPDVTLGRSTLGNAGRVGADANADIMLGPNKTISRVHARIIHNSATKTWEFYCLSKNGAFVDG
jgi:hypothetical protein